MLNYIKASIKRKIARRITKEYPYKIINIDMGNLGVIEFANWDNPLVYPHIPSASMVEFFKKFIKEGDFAIDIGANIGDTSVPIALCTGKTGLTLGFDPNPFVFKILEKNASINNHLYNLKAIPYAISNVDEEYFYISSEASFSNGGISKTKDSNHGKYIYHEKIKGINLSDFLEKNYPTFINKLSFIKIDTEGYDKEIIKSISNLINKYKPVIVAEIFGKDSDENKIELFEVIEKNGYNIFYFDDFYKDTKIEKLQYISDIIKIKNNANLFAVPK